LILGRYWASQTARCGPPRPRQSAPRRLRWPSDGRRLFVERVVERFAAKTQCNQCRRCDLPCYLCRSCHRSRGAGPS
jgi:hypothetical protein